MVHIQKHAEEIFWLQRRINFLETLNDLLEDDALPQEAQQIASQYRKVENPEDLVARLKDIYGIDLQ